MLDVADEFSTKLLAAQRDLKRLHPVLGDTSTYEEKKESGERPWEARSRHVSELVNNARTAIREAEASRGRIMVLYRPDSFAAKFAEHALKAMSYTTVAVEAWEAHATEETFDEAMTSFDGAEETVRDFCDQAWVSLSSPLGPSPWGRFVGWYRRRRFDRRSH